MRHANVGGVDVAIDIEVGDIAVLFFANEIRQPAHRQKIVRFIERDTVFGAEAFAGQDFCGHRLEASIIYLQSV